VLGILALAIVFIGGYYYVKNSNYETTNDAQKVGLGFIVAKLGKRENRTLFIENQPVYPNMSDWLTENNDEIVRKVDKALDSRIVQLHCFVSIIVVNQKLSSSAIRCSMMANWLP
jgi:hypothetical protein